MISSRDDALLLLNKWRDERTSLIVGLAGPGVWWSRAVVEACGPDVLFTLRDDAGRLLTRIALRLDTADFEYKEPETAPTLPEWFGGVTPEATLLIALSTGDFFVIYKKIEMHAHSLALHFTFYNFCKVHSSLRVTPAMEAGLSDHVWSAEELIALLNVSISETRTA